MENNKSPKNPRSPRMLFPITPGRSGTMFLANLCVLLPGVTSLHEPKPLVSDVWFKLRTQPHLADPFLEVKKTWINKICEEEKTNIYIETCHLLCKGFFEPMIKLGWKFECIHLYRPIEEVAASLHRIGDIPARTKTGRKYYLHPEDPNNITKIGSIWRSLTDYQLCYWYAYEMKCRACFYKFWLPKQGVKITSVSLSQLSTLKGFLDFVKEADLPKPLEVNTRLFEMITSIQWNYKATRKRCGPGLPNNITEQEEEFLDKIQTGDKKCKL